MINIAICDDQAEHVKKLQDLIEKARVAMPERLECHICGAFRSADKVEAFMSESPVNILFLDIELKGENGFELAARLNDAHPDIIIIFVSSYENYVFRAFEYEPFRFIRKAMLEEELAPALYAACEKYLGSGRTMLIDAVDGAVTVRQKDIVYFESLRNYSVAHTLDGGKFKFRSTLAQLEEKFGKDDFCRIHNAYVINLANVKRIDGSSGVVMKDDTKLAVGARHRGAFKAAYMEFTNKRFAKC